MIVDYIDGHKQEYGVEPICRVLTAHGCKIAPSTYYDACARRRQPCRRQVRDEELKVDIARVHRENYGVYGAVRCGCNAAVRASTSPAARSNVW